MSEIDWSVDVQPSIGFNVEPSLNVQWSSDEYVEVVERPAPRYGGPYEATPTSEAQVFQTEELHMTGNFTVKPIPSNYGLITWNGSVITVS